MLQNNKMNLKKRKASDESCSEDESKDCQSETSSEKNAGSEYMAENQQKSENDGSSELPGTSHAKIKSGDDLKDSDNRISEQREKKLTKLEGSNTAGTLLFCGGTNWDLIGRRKLPKNIKKAEGVDLLGPHRLASLKGIRVASAFSSCCAAHSVIITEKGQAYTWGRNDSGQLGHGDTKRKDIPTLVETLKNTCVVSAACGRAHTLFLTDKGTTYASGFNKFGQCGSNTENTTLTVPTKVSFKGGSVAKVACGADFSIMVDMKGGVFTFGSPEYGQLGHNTECNDFFTLAESADRCESSTPRRVVAFIDKTKEGHVTKIEDVQIVDVACGNNHSLAVDKKGYCFSWGFSGYGRLGHNVQRDEFLPRLIKTFDGPSTNRVKKVFAGSTYSMAIDIQDVLFFWGQQKAAGDATMYPKPIPDLIGWKVRDVGCGYKSIVCVTDQAVIAWGPSPTYGELGYGEWKPKSSTVPLEVKPLKGIHIHSVTMGYGHTLLIARDDTEEDRKKLEEKFPEFTP